MSQFRSFTLLKAHQMESLGRRESISTWNGIEGTYCMGGMMWKVLVQSTLPLMAGNEGCILNIFSTSFSIVQEFFIV